MQEFAYRVIWIRERGEGEAAVEIARGVLFPGPLTHAEACTCMRKVRPYPGRRLVADYLVAEKERDATEFARAVPGLASLASSPSFLLRAWMSPCRRWTGSSSRRCATAHRNTEKRSITHER